MVIIFIQSFSFVSFILSFEKYSFVINVATLGRKVLHPEIGTPMLVPTPAVDSYMLQLLAR